MLEVRYRKVARGAAAVVLAACAAVIGSQFVLAQQRAQDHKTWMDYGGGPDNSKYSALDQINKSNVNQLAVAWTYPTQDNVAYLWNPIVVDNVMYVLARNNSLVA